MASPRRHFDPPAVDLVEHYIRAMRTRALAQWGAPVVDIHLNQVEQVATKARRELTTGVQEQFSRAEGDLLMSIGDNLIKSAVVAPDIADSRLRADLGSGAQEIGRTILARLADS